jgi:hypothetical protein
VSCWLTYGPDSWESVAKCGSDFGEYSFGSLIDVCCGVAKETVTNAGQPVLSPVIFGDALTMGLAVIFDDKPRGPVVEVRPGHESSSLIV